MAKTRLYVSFWDVCLDTLPLGTFAHRQVAPSAAKTLVSAARRRKSLLCLTDTDILAPYHKQELDKHRKLCQQLGRQMGIKLSVSDFCHEYVHDKKKRWVANGLNGMQLQRGEQLLVITCAYVLAPLKRGASLNFSIAPSTIAFNLIEPT